MAGYWMYETSGVLRPVIEAYLNGHEMTGEQMATMRSYLRQWIVHFRGPDVTLLRAQLDDLDTSEKLGHWFDRALDAGIDPL